MQDLEGKASWRMPCKPCTSMGYKMKMCCNWNLTEEPSSCTKTSRTSSRDSISSGQTHMHARTHAHTHARTHLILERRTWVTAFNVPNSHCCFWALLILFHMGKNSDSFCLTCQSDPMWQWSYADPMLL